MIEPVKLSLVVECPAQHAFDTWTAKTTAWWPRRHTVSGDDCQEVVFEPRVGGRIFERSSSGQEIEWGEVTTWDPPRRVGYIWHIAIDRADATDVEIIFSELPDATTRIDIEHRGWERLGDIGPVWRDTNKAGWDGVLPAYRSACLERPTVQQPSGRER